MSIDLNAMRAAHVRGELDDLDIDMLLAEVDRLTAELAEARAETASAYARGERAIADLIAELAESRAAYDAVCRSIGASLRRSAAE